MLDRYRTLKRGETSILDYPAIMHFHASGMIEVDSPAVADCLEFISESCLDQTHQMPDNFIAMLNPKKRLPTIPQLKRLDTGLGFLRSNIEMMAHDPQFTAFIEPSLRGLFKNRFLQSDLSKLEKFPNILSFVVETSILEKKEGLRTPTLESVHLAEISSDFIEPFKRLQVSQSKTFEQHTKLLILDWRIQTIGSQNEEDFSPSCKQREKNAFLSLWSALSRGVPDSKKEFALSVKDHCVEFVMDCLSKSPRYRPDPAMVEFLAAHRPQNEILMWLQIAKAGPNKAKAIFGRLPERPKVMPFDVFYALYENYGLKSNPIFIEKYFDALPLEARREILIPWLRRATHDSQSNKQIDLLLASTFDKLLKADRFPVNELTGSAELEGDLVFWSLAFAFKSGLDLRGLSYSRLHILLMTLSRIESKILWKRLGEDLVLVLIPQMLKLENVKKGINKPLIHLLQSTHSSLILLRLKVFLEQNVTLFNFDPAWQSLIDYLDQQAQPAKKRGRLPVTKGKSKPKKVEGGYRPF
ncbi:MAG: hypothetical protein H7318_10410 [Oligoflexus sp.]|nr:hypothetical protein [Oligoflexus sp.]